VYADAQHIATAYREGVPVIFNVSGMIEEEARRLIDFSAGLSQGLYGRIEKVTGKVFLLTPAHVTISGDEPANDSGVIDTTFFGR
jgi:cell division inhibitor SepF